MNKWRFTFIVLIVGIFYAYKEMKKTYRSIPAGKKYQSKEATLNDSSNQDSILKEKSANQKPEVFYYITIDRFFDGNKNNQKNVDPYNSQAFHGGDLEGIEEKLDYIKDLGVSSIILSNPMLQYKTPHFYNNKQTGEEYERYPFRGNKATSLSEIDSNFGTMSDLKSLTSKAHDLGLKIYVSLNLSYLDKNTTLLQREDADILFNKRAPICKTRSSEDLLKCVPPRRIRFNHDSKEAQEYIFSQIVSLHEKTNIDGVLARGAQHYTESFIGFIFFSVVNNIKFKNFNFIFDVTVRGQPFYNKLFNGDSSGFIQYNDFSLSLMKYLSKGKDRKKFLKELTNHGNLKRSKYYVSDLTAFEPRSTSTIYKNNLKKILKHVSILGFTNTNIQMTYGEELGAEHARFPYYYLDMPWEKVKKFKKYRESLSRIFISRTKNTEFLKGRIKIVYDQEGLVIIAKTFNEKIVGYLAINESDEDKTVFHEYQMPLRKSIGKDLITNSQFEAFDNGVTFTLDPNGVQFIMF
tara:strand:+ start:276 stop:1835 length:1560 start_codon:yes stop_codon:yes gene_type:complete